MNCHRNTRAVEKQMNWIRLTYDSRIIKRATLILEKSCGELDEFGINSTDSIWLPCWKFREKVIALEVGRNLEPTSPASNPESISLEHPILQTLKKMCIPTWISRFMEVCLTDRQLNWKNSYRALAISIFKGHISSLTLLITATWDNHWVIVANSEIAKIRLRIRCIYIKPISMRIVGVNWRDRSTYSTNKWPNLI